MGNAETRPASRVDSLDGVSTPLATPREEGGLFTCSVDARTCAMRASPRTSRPESKSTLAAWERTGAKWRTSGPALDEDDASQAHKPYVRPELIELGLALAREEHARRSSSAGALHAANVPIDAQGNFSFMAEFCECRSSPAHVGGVSESPCGSTSFGPGWGRGGRVSGCSGRAPEVVVNRVYAELLVI